MSKVNSRFRTYDDLPDWLVVADDIDERPIELLPWGAHGLELSIGDLNLFAAHPGSLKSTLACKIAALVSHERPVLVITEEDPHKATRPRLRLMGARLGNVWFARRPVTPEDLIPLAVEKGLGLVVGDPVSTAFVVTDSNNNDEVRYRIDDMQERVLAPHGVTFLGLVHFSKNTSRDTGLGRMMGASAFGQMSRQVYVMGRAPDDEDHVDVADEKHSYSKRHPTVRHRIVPFPQHRGLVDLQEVCRVQRTAAEVVQGKPSADGALATWVLQTVIREGSVLLTDLCDRARDENLGGRTKVRAVVRTLVDDPDTPLDTVRDGRQHRVFVQGGPQP